MRSSSVEAPDKPIAKESEYDDPDSNHTSRTLPLWMW